ncbi:MAG: PAS domain-containing sensor histidine kinase, partial [Pseudolabrys sp.]|nr:PAS domain-containing sensor histidine kinase [Pseudolabrys sp.]
SKLHIRIVGLFSVIAAAPAVLVAIVASVTLDRGLDTLFSTRTRAAIENSVIVADAYLRSQAQSLRSDVVLMAFDLARAKPVFDKEPDKLQQFLTFQASLRGLAAINVFDDRAKIVDKADIPVEHVFALPPPEALGSISDSEPQIVLLPDADYVAAAIKLREYTDRYLYVARLLDPRVLTQLRVTQASASEYAAIESRRLGIQVAFALMYTVIALIVLLSAVWIGLDFANRLVAPIRRLIGAANVVSTGNLFVRVPVRQSEGDLAHLGETFNRMTQELRTQRDDIVRARDLIDSRRRFTEAVLSGASAGVIGIDDHNQITILNRSAEKLVGCAEPDALGKPVTNIAPELVAILGQAQAGAQRLTQGQVTINRGGRERILQVRVTREQAAEAERGYVLTLDDITELVFAQRTSAWADVARRIAHEIKNPLTPIQLAAERLRRKYIKAIGDDTTVFEQCTDTIVRQVDDIKRMVDEFSRFARMPKPVIEADDVADAVRQAVFLLKVGHPDLDIKVEFAEDPMPARFDRRLISQAVTNVIKNATEAISAVPPETLGKGRIAVFVSRKGHQILVDVVDNGVGLPKENRSRLLEPYVTTREKGTGLGLAIVGRILEEHGGTIELRDAEEKIPGQRGAWVQIRFADDTVISKTEPEKQQAGSES